MALNLEFCSPQEKKFLYDIILPSLSDDSEKFIFPQHEVLDSDGKKRKLDFAIITESSKIALELDGYTYHAEGVVSQDKFGDDLSRQNELILDGWKVIRFSWKQINLDSEHCRGQLRRLILSDPDLHPSLKKGDIKPHFIQVEALKRLEETRKKGRKRGLVALATGLGKTFLSAFDAKSVGGRILFIVHNNSILEQAKSVFSIIFPDSTSGFFNGLEKQKDKQIVFANIASLRDEKHLHTFDKDEFSYVIIDEFHHAATSNYKKVIDYFEPLFCLGLTATPNRTDEKSILSLVEDNLVYQVTQKEAIESGFLSPFHYHALKDNVDYSSIRHNGFKYVLEDLNKKLIVKDRDSAIIEKYREITKESKSIGFCVSIEHTERSAEHFNNAGIPAVAIHSRLDNTVRVKLIEDFRNNKYKVVFVRDIFNEGIDFPDVSALLFMRPTESKIIFTQQLGRGLRLSSGKTHVAVLDFIGNYINSDKIVDYLSDLGEPLSFDEVSGKPVYVHDTGCEINFEAGLVDVITSVNKVAITDQSIVQDFFELNMLLRRVPSFSDIQSSGKYKIPEYLDIYGSWDNFLGRIKMLDPDIDTTHLVWPDDLKDVDLFEFSCFFENDAENFNLVVSESRDCVLEIVDLFKSLELYYVGINSYKIVGTFELLHKALFQLENNLRRIIIALSYRFNNLLLEKSFDEKIIHDFNIDVITKNFKLVLSDIREVYTFPKSFSKSINTMSAYFVEAANNYLSSSVDADIQSLKILYETAIKVSRLIPSDLADLQKFIDISES